MAVHPAQHVFFCFLLWKTSQESIKELSAHGWAAVKASSVPMMALLPTLSSPPAFSELWGGIADPRGSLDALCTRAPSASSFGVIATGQKETYFKHSWLVLRWITESLNSDASRERPAAFNICATETQTKLWEDRPW